MQDSDVTSATDLVAIRQQYRRLASRYHPDRFHTAEERAAATVRFQSIAEAFALLRSEARQRRKRRAAPSSTSQSSSWPSPARSGQSAWWNQVDLQDVAASAELGKAADRRWGTSATPGSVRKADSSWLLLLPILLPSIVAMRLSRTLIMLFQDELILPDKLSNVLGLLIGHLAPGLLGAVVGRELVGEARGRDLLAILYGLWWVVSGALAFAMDRTAS